jgi:hypothetical protein
MDKILNTIGLLLTIFGVLLLFRYGVAFQVQTGGHSMLITSQSSPELIKQERRNIRLSYLALFLIVVGTFLQIVANWV